MDAIRDSIIIHVYVNKITKEAEVGNWDTVASLLYFMGKYHAQDQLFNSADFIEKTLDMFAVECRIVDEVCRDSAVVLDVDTAFRAARQHDHEGVQHRQRPCHENGIDQQDQDPDLLRSAPYG